MATSLSQVRDSRDPRFPSNLVYRTWRRVATRWLHLVYDREILVHIGASAILAVAAEFVLLRSPIHIDHLAQGLMVHAAIIIGALLVPFLFTVLALTPQLRFVMKILAAGPGSGRTAAEHFLAEELSSMLGTLRDLSGGGANLDVYQVARWVRRCFETAGGRYVGTDSNVPSAFRALYADYLDAHQEYIQRSGIQNTVRVLINDVSAIRHDNVYNEDDFSWFFSWHDRNNAQLLILDRPTAIRKASEADSFRHTDVGFWDGDFALLFEPNPTNGRVTLRLTFPGQPDYERCEKYLTAILPVSRPISEHLPWFTDELSEHWEEFVAPERRLSSLEPFLTQILSAIGEPSRVRILDAAMGIGVEVTWLLARGYYVVGNEIEPSLRKKAEQYAARHDTSLPSARLTQSNWLRFQQDFGSSSFNVVLCLGNSLSLLEGSREVRDALTALRNVLAPGGILVVDERNFGRIMNSGAWKGNEFSDPWGNFRYGKTVVYCGDGVRGAPFRKANGRVVFDYLQFDRDRPGAKLGELSMYAFRQGEMLEILRSLGFDRIEVFNDLRESEGFDQNADFFTYVCHVPEGRGH